MDRLIVEPSPKKILPPAAFRAVRDLPCPFLLGGAHCEGHRYSYVGAGPFMTMEVPFDSGAVIIKDKDGGTKKLQDEKNPFDVIAETIKKYSAGIEKGPFPFNGGWAGFFSYDLKDLLFKLPETRAEKKALALKLPLSVAGLYDTIYVYDHFEGAGWFVSAAVDNGSPERFKRFKERIIKGAAKYSGEKIPRPSLAPFSSSITREVFIDSVKKAKEYIAAGDIYQINLSQRLDAPFTGDPFTLYEGLITTNPTPFSSFFDFKGFSLISNSPERLLRVEGSLVETCPIKGTRKRGAGEEEDLSLIGELKESPKERAEHVMIVDLERSDLGRISIPGTVKVSGFEEIETYSKLHHMVSTVRGKLTPGVSTLLALKKIFPGGSITGAPKIRAMEIIEELENSPREVYTGGVGFIDFSGDMDISIAIRTALYKDEKIYLHVGGGIVADSVPEEEYDETILKAMDFFEVLNIKAGSLT
ncbi:MAG: anthranilate synthase component I family protein [Thermodesulfobacteriota bacterium]